MSTVILFSIVVVLITSALLLILQKTAVNVLPGAKKITNRDPTFIIAGPSNSGKTSLFTLLTTDSVKPTVMSQEPSIATDYLLPSNIKNIKFKLMEYPGHIKLRYQLFDILKESSFIKGLIFVVDSTVDPKKLTETAEFLYEILSITERKPDGVDILIACNKSESFTSRPPVKIRQALEKEINSVIARKMTSLSSVKKDSEESSESGSERGDELLEVNSKQGFKFDLLDGNIDAMEGSVLKNNIEKWECWIDERAVN